LTDKAGAEHGNNVPAREESIEEPARRAHLDAPAVLSGHLLDRYGGVPADTVVLADAVILIEIVSAVVAGVGGN
jgi:hypothetical protein